MKSKLIFSLLLSCVYCQSTNDALSSHAGAEGSKAQVEQSSAHVKEAADKSNAKADHQDAHHVVDINSEYLMHDVSYSNSSRFYDNLVFRIFPNLSLSGSSQYTERQFRDMMQFIVNQNNLQNEVLLILDLRGEAHLFFQHQLTNEKGEKMQMAAEPLILSDKKKRELEYFQEREIIDDIDGKKVTIQPHRFAKDYKTILTGEVVAQKPFEVVLHKEQKQGMDLAGLLETEEDMIKRVGATLDFNSPESLDKVQEGMHMVYKRIPIADLTTPTFEHYEKIMNAIKQVEAENPGKRVWVHVHCHGGLGRTAFGMYIAHMMRSDDSLEKIVDEQTKKGARNLLDIEHPEIGQSLETAKQIRDRVEQVYRYYRAAERDRADGKTQCPMPESKKNEITEENFFSRQRLEK